MLTMPVEKPALRNQAECVRKQDREAMESPPPSFSNSAKTVTRDWKGSLGVAAHATGTLSYQKLPGQLVVIYLRNLMQ